MNRGWLVLLLSIPSLFSLFLLIIALAFQQIPTVNVSTKKSRDKMEVWFVLLFFSSSLFLSLPSFHRRPKLTRLFLYYVSLPPCRIKKWAAEKKKRAATKQASIVQYRDLEYVSFFSTKTFSSPSQLFLSLSDDKVNLQLTDLCCRSVPSEVVSTSLSSITSRGRVLSLPPSLLLFLLFCCAVILA